MRIYCEERNQFFKGENERMTFWSKKEEEAQVFSDKEAKQKIKILGEEIISSSYLIEVS